MRPTCIHLRDFTASQIWATICPLQSCGDQLSHTVDNTEVQLGQQETSQAKKHDQSESDEALYLPPLPPDQLDTVVKVTTTHIGSLYIHVYCICTVCCTVYIT